MLYKYSIIIPHKNIPQLLRRCLSSIPEREDIQVIVVDDASECIDEVNSIVQDYKNTELIVTKEGKGAGYARNKGLLSAKGEWILFADADDFFEEGFIDVIEKHKSDEADVVFFAAKSVYCDSLNPSPKLSKRNNVIARYKDNPKKLDDYFRYFQTEPWGKMIRRDLICEKGIKFDETLLANDYYFSIVSGYYASKLVYDNSVVYVYTEREGSLSYKLTANEKTLLARLGVYKHVQDFMDLHKISYAPFYRYSFSEYINKNSNFSNVVEKFWEENGIAKSYVIYRYIKAKLYQYICGVNL